MHLTLILSTLFTCSLATCPTTIIQDGGFESGVRPPGGPWWVDTITGSPTYALSSPGSTNNGGGQYAFDAIIRPGGIPYSDGVERLRQTLTTCAGQNYSITADYRFQSKADSTNPSGDCSVKLEYPYKTTRGSVTTPSGLSPAGVWYTTAATFQAVSSASELYFVFACANRKSNVISVDNVKVVPYSGNAY